MAHTGREGKAGTKLYVETPTFKLRPLDARFVSRVLFSC